MAQEASTPPAGRPAGGGAAGRPRLLPGWPVPRVVERCRSCATTAWRVAAGGIAALLSAAGRAGPAMRQRWRLAAAIWQRVARHDDHPWNEGLLVEALLAQARRPGRQTRRGRVCGGQRLDTLGAMSDKPVRDRPAHPGPWQALGSGHWARPSVIQLVFREKGALYAAYMPVLADGGLFVPTTREYRLGEDIYLLLSLPDDPQRYPVAGKVAWITPANASGGRTQGVGVRFPADEKTRR
jgi:type IV pilus assembly protein PilZ